MLTTVRRQHLWEESVKKSVVAQRVRAVTARPMTAIAEILGLARRTDVTLGASVGSSRRLT